MTSTSDWYDGFAVRLDARWDWCFLRVGALREHSERVVDLVHLDRVELSGGTAEQPPRRAGAGDDVALTVPHGAGASG
jgi:hypothetical protein